MDKCIVTGWANHSKGKAQCAMGVETCFRLWVQEGFLLGKRKGLFELRPRSESFLSTEWGGEHSRWREQHGQRP